MRDESNARNLSCQRDGVRTWPAHADRAWIDVPELNGRIWSLPLVNLGPEGIGFGIDGTALADKLTPGKTLTLVVLHVGEVEILGTFRVAHVTEGFSTGKICGGQFEPAGEDAAATYRRLLVGDQAVDSQD